jgi:hypothetical protein
MRRHILADWQDRRCHFYGMPDSMAIAASGFQAAIALPSQVAAAAAPAALAVTPAPPVRAGFILAYNPNAPFANLQDLVAVPDTDPKAKVTGALQTSNGGSASPVVYRIASHLYRSLRDQ